MAAHPGTALASAPLGVFQDGHQLNCPNRANQRWHSTFFQPLSIRLWSELITKLLVGSIE